MRRNLNKTEENNQKKKEKIKSLMCLPLQLEPIYSLHGP